MSIRIRTCANQNNDSFKIRESLSPSLDTSLSFFLSLRETMAASVDPLVVGRVIGDVLDMFIPTANMSVYFGPKHITNGCEIKPSTAINPPKVNISGHSDELYTLVYTYLLTSIHLCINLPHMCLYAYALQIHDHDDHDHYNKNMHAANPSKISNGFKSLKNFVRIWYIIIYISIQNIVFAIILLLTYIYIY